MRAVVFEGVEQVAVHDIPDPILSTRDGAVVQIEQTSICGSDLHFFWGESGSPEGVRPGHEFIGTVVETGPDVRNVAVGDRVMAMALYGCGHCAGCQELRPTACSTGWVNFGTIAGQPGGQAELIEVPTADVILRKLPDWISDDQAVLLTDVLPTGAYGAYNAAITPGSTVVVIGLGPIGLSAAANALTYQPERVIAFDGLPERRARAASLGIETFDPATAPLTEQVMELTGGLGADSVIEAVGHPDTVLASLSCARVHGTVAGVGVTIAPIPFVPAMYMARNLTIRFVTTDVPLMWNRVLPLLERGQLDLGDDVFTHRLPLADAPHAYDVFAGRREQVFKIVLDPRR